MVGIGNIRRLGSLLGREKRNAENPIIFSPPIKGIIGFSTFETISKIYNFTFINKCNA